MESEILKPILPQPHTSVSSPVDTAPTTMPDTTVGSSDRGALPPTTDPIHSTETTSLSAPPCDPVEATSPVTETEEVRN